MFIAFMTCMKAQLLKFFQASCAKLQVIAKVVQDNNEMLSESDYKIEPKNIVAQRTDNYE